MSAAASKENSPTKADKPEKPLFTEREEKLLKVAWFCLKSGPPDIDLNKFMKHGEFNTMKTCSNQWGTLKKKIASLAPKDEDGDEAAEPATPKAKATPKKRGKKADADAEGGDDEEIGSPKKKTKSPAAKKTAKKVTKKEETEEDIGEDIKVKGEEVEE